MSWVRTNCGASSLPSLGFSLLMTSWLRRGRSCSTCCVNNGNGELMSGNVRGEEASGWDESLRNASHNTLGRQRESVDGVCVHVQPSSKWKPCMSQLWLLNFMRKQWDFLFLSGPECAMSSCRTTGLQIGYAREKTDEWNVNELNPSLMSDAFQLQHLT